MSFHTGDREAHIKELTCLFITAFNKIIPGCIFKFDIHFSIAKTANLKNISTSLNLCK